MKSLAIPHRRWLGGVLLGIGLALILPLLVNYVNYRREQNVLQQAWLRETAESSAHPTTLFPFPPPKKSSNSVKQEVPTQPAKQDVKIDYPAPLVGKLSIPRINLSDVILDGTSLTILNFGPGHLLGSPYPGQPGNSIIAAHNDLEFHNLGQLQAGDLIYITDKSGKIYKYKTEQSRILGPHDVISLNSTKPTLTLSTCYPFNAYKDTPYRYIVTALLTG